MQILIKKKTKKDLALSWLFLFLLQCTVSNDCFYKLSLATPHIMGSSFLRYIRGCDMPEGAIYLLRQMRKNEKGRV